MDGDALSLESDRRLNAGLTLEIGADRSLEFQESAKQVIRTELASLLKVHFLPYQIALVMLLRGLYRGKLMMPFRCK